MGIDGPIALVFLLYQKGRLEVFRPGPSYRRSPPLSALYKRAREACSARSRMTSAFHASIAAICAAAALTCRGWRLRVGQKTSFMIEVDPVCATAGAAFK